jgi:hypothetical protein
MSNIMNHKKYMLEIHEYLDKNRNKCISYLFSYNEFVKEESLKEMTKAMIKQDKATDKTNNIIVNKH